MSFKLFSLILFHVEQYFPNNWEKLEKLLEWELPPFKLGQQLTTTPTPQLAGAAIVQWRALALGKKMFLKSWANVSSKDLKNVKMQSFQRIKNLLYVQRELCCTDGDGALEVGKETRNTKKGFLSLKFVCRCSPFLFCFGYIHSTS